MNSNNEITIKSSRSWIAGLQWFFFIFANIVFIPLTVGQAFKLEYDVVFNMLQITFILTGIACLVQAFYGHRRAILEGQSGLWWGILLTIINTSVAHGLSIGEIGGSIATGIFISGGLTIILALTGTIPHIAKLFKPNVMGVFMLLFGMTLMNMFIKGMFGLPYTDTKEAINLGVGALSIVLSIMVIIFDIKSKKRIRSFGLLLGILVGWIAYDLIFGPDQKYQSMSFSLQFFPAGKPDFNIGIIITTVIAGLLNLANTIGAIKGTNEFYDDQGTKGMYRRSVTISGIFSAITGLFGVVPYAPYVSSVGFLSQTEIYKRLPFIIGSVLFLLIGLIPPVGSFFATVPLSVGSTVLFVAYLQLFKSSIDNFKEITFNPLNIYRAAIPVFVGAIVMILPSEVFSSFPSMIRPLVSNGLIVGILLALILENIFKWDEMKE